MLVGIDLAWGHRSPTGVAVARLDPAGGARVHTLTAVRSDAELDAVLAEALAGSCVVGIDAPLKVENPTGRRPCEAAVSRAFGPEHAGAYPSNTGLPHFADGGRAAAFVRRHVLAVDATVASTPGDRRALEVFPHSVAVAVFDLARVLPYKARTGRTLESRRAALSTLLDLIASLGSGGSDTGLPVLQLPSAMLADLRAGIATAPTAAALRRLEDPVDALLCVYAALLFVEERTVVLGDPETGTLVTPVRARHLQRLGTTAPVSKILPVDRLITPSSGHGSISPLFTSRKDAMSLTDEDIVTTRTGGSTMQAGGDADQSDSDSTQVDPAGVDPAGADQAGGDADQSDSDSTQVDPAGVDPAGVDQTGGGDADQSDSDSTQVDPAGVDPAGSDPAS